ncbi:hypothetical protein J7J64_04040, partial [Lysobacter sp. ISL-42]|nr:hypothetical protein [Lysobacter sp. ISL-42]MBT2753512.1 hypothetical protein [Lysobacter sp. ISL-50]MBT2780270.1 hypothetical protein [Lysobacter sp. ISL-52]
RWKLMQARATLKATGAKGETRFVPNIYPEKLVAQQAEITYFAKASYLDDEVTTLDNPVSYGRTDRSKMTHLRDDELFTITLTPKAATP